MFLVGGQDFERSVVSYFPVFLPVRVLVVGGGYLSRKRVRSLLDRTREMEVVGECRTATDAFGTIHVEVPDLLCVDLETADLAGLALLETTPPERCPQVLFLTTPAKNLQQAFEIHTLDYLHKPFTDEGFYDALRPVCRRVLQDRLGQDRTTHQRVLGVLAQLRGRSYIDHGQVLIPAKESGMYQVIGSHEIDWIEAKNRGVLIHVGTQAYWLRQTLADVERQLDPRMFVRIHRSRIVNCTRISALKRLWKGEYSVILQGGKSLASGRTYQRSVSLLSPSPGRAVVCAQPPRPLAVSRNGASTRAAP